ncbi:MAG: hypothetical protein HY403_04875 [Elusimicrobia bacterium]|nr:hypothetical protein [Elusimicrobiota bacterium]
MSGTSRDAKAAAPAGANRGRRLLTAKIAACAGGGYALRALQLALLLELLIFFAATGLAFFSDLGRHRGYARLVAAQADVERPATSLIKRAMPTNFKGSDISRWLFAFFIYVLSTNLGHWAERLAEVAARARRRRDGGVNEGDMVDLQHTLKALASGKSLDRRKLLQIYAETKKTLEKQKRYVAFLSIDVVNSTGMKLGEARETAERDFILYKKMVERALNNHRSLKSAWTPDGVMICFNSVDDAVGAGQEIVRGLAEFNRRVKTIKHDFALRIGVNAGEVSYDELIPMEEMTDRVIDIAGHMQKHGAIDAVSVTKHAIEPLLGRFDFKPAGRVVDGCEVYEWRLPSEPA